MDNANVKGADDLVRKLTEAKQYMEDDVFDVVGIEAVKLFKQNFQKESFNGKKWAARKTKRAGSTNSQKILSKSGELAESIDYRKEKPVVVISSDKVYAEIHNEGGTIHHPGGERVVTHKKHTRGKKKGKTLFAKNDEKASFSQKTNIGAYDIVMPQRQYMGEMPELEVRINDKVMRDLTNILK